LNKGGFYTKRPSRIPVPDKFALPEIHLTG
jgi:hypothetical protein